MSTPTGYPDYARLSLQAGQILNIVSGQNINTNPKTPAINTTGFGYLVVGINDITLTAKFWVQVAYYTDPGLTNQVATQGFFMPPGGQAARQHVVIAQFVQVTMIYLSGTTTDQPVMTIYGINVSAEYMNVANVADHIMQNNQSVAASSSFVLTGSTVPPPVVTVSLWHATNNVWHAILKHWDRNVAAFVEAMHIEGATAGLHFVARIDVAPSQLQLTVFNDDTVARQMTACVTGS